MDAVGTKVTICILWIVCGLHTYEMTSKQEVFTFLNPVGSYCYHV